MSDGFAHAFNFQVEGISSGQGEVQLDAAGTITASAIVSFAPETPRGVAHGTQRTARGRRVIGDTVLLHGERVEDRIPGGPVKLN